MGMCMEILILYLDEWKCVIYFFIQRLSLFFSSSFNEDMRALMTAKKAKLFKSDLDEESQQGKNNVKGSSAFSDPCTTLDEHQQRQ